MITGLFKRLYYVFSRRKEIEALIKQEEERQRLAEWEATKDNLSLCKRHAQERNRSEFSEHNCDHCRLQKRLKNHQWM